MERIVSRKFGRCFGRLGYKQKQDRKTLQQIIKFYGENVDVNTKKRKVEIKAPTQHKDKQKEL